MPVALPQALRPFLTMSYPIDGFENGLPATMYEKGYDDVLFVVTAAIILTVARHIVMEYILSPFARAYIPRAKLNHAYDDPAMRKRHLRAHDRKHEHAAARFAEQGWSMLYFAMAEALGLVILYRIPNRTSPQELWGTYPYHPLPWLTKFYYLGQLGWWFHQVYVINMEKRRKDHWQMCFHHFVSIILVMMSYVGNYTRVGTLIHTLMDVCDILLPLAKLLRYLEFKTACDATFVLFLLSWLGTRQIAFACLVYQTGVSGPPVYIRYEWNHQTGHYFNPFMYWTFTILLSILLVLCSLWFWMALRVAIRVVRGEGAEDSRSDSEDMAEESEGEAENVHDEETELVDDSEDTEDSDDVTNKNEYRTTKTNGVANATTSAVHTTAINGHAQGLKRRT